MTKTSDVLIVGGGIFGLSTAFSMLKAGLSVTLIDKDAPGSGPSGGIVGALSPHMPENWNSKKAFQLRALLEAPAFWRSVEELSEHPTGYARIGRLMPISSQKGLDLAHKRTQNSSEYWPSNLSWSVTTEFSSGWLASGPFGAVSETLSARIFPRAACSALSQAILKMDGQIVKATVSKVESGRVALADGTAHQAKSIVVAAGYASFSLLSFPANFGAEVKGQAALLEDVQKTGALIFSNGVYILPHHDGRVAVGSTSEKTYENPKTTDAQLDALIDQARSICPALQSGKVVERWAGLRPRASLPDPILGEMPGLPGVIIASGAFKVGFGLAPLIAKSVLDLIDGRDGAIPSIFTPQSHLNHAALHTGKR